MKSYAPFIEKIFSESKSLKKIVENQIFTRVLLNKMIVTPNEIRKILLLKKDFGVCCNNDRLEILLFNKRVRKDFNTKKYFRPQPARQVKEIARWWKSEYGKIGGTS